MKTLLVLAAGMGSRFGGLKQITPFGPSDEFIIDYSIYDAIKCGFDKVVFIIKKENYDIFKETIGKRIEDKIKVEYAFQDLDKIPNGYTLNKDRVKPLGTGHAILCAKEYINEPFLIINSDDFYGRNAYNEASKFLDNPKGNEYAIIGYNVTNTMTEYGSVKRGLCVVEDGNLKEINECKIERINNELVAESIVTNEKEDINEDSVVSMNMIAFTPSIFDYLEDKFNEFLDNSSDSLTDEFLIPEVIKMGINEGKFNVKVINTDAVWAGVTYKEDTDSVKKYIKKLVKTGEYKNNLWND